MRRILFAIAAICAAVAALLVVPSAAGARTAVDLHKVNLKNLTIPGSTCYSNHSIGMHNGHGAGGKFDGMNLVADEYGKPVYGDITHDGHYEAFVAVDCSNGGGTAASDVRFTWVVFTGGAGVVRVLGVLSPQHQWLNSYPTVLQQPKIVADVVFVHETIWFADDPDCCGTAAASVTWSVQTGALKVRTSVLQVTDRIVTTTTVGHASVGETPAQLKKYYGSSLHSLLYSTGCRDYYHGAHQDPSFNAFVDTTKSNKVFGIYAPTGSVTRAGIGTYATIAQIKKVYAGHKIIIGAGNKNVYVQFPSSWIGFSMDTSQSPVLVRSMRIGQFTFVNGKHTCTN